MRDILVHVARSEPWGNGVRYAGVLASSLHASLTAFHRPEAASMPASGRGSSPTGTAMQLREEAIIAALAKETAFRAYASSLGVKHGAWVVHDGPATSALVHLAQWHDLLVFEREDVVQHPETTLGPLQLVAHAPCLVVPAACAASAAPGCVALLWDGSPSSIRVLHAAIPLLERARRVILLIGGKYGALSLEPGLPPFDLERYCEAHELETERVALDKGWSGDDVLQCALGADAEFLVMAAQGRTRMSSRLFDRHTRHVLRCCPVPLLLRH